MNDSFADDEEAQKGTETKIPNPDMISLSEISYFTDGIKQGVRGDGRTSDAMRPLKLELGVVPTANGSCRVQSKACDIYVAIKCAIGRPSPVAPEEGVFSVAVEFGCSVLPRLQDFSGRQATIEAETLSEIVANHISSMCLSSLNKKQFCIEPRKVCWLVSIDVLVERVDGPLIDPISIGVRGALMDLELPHVTLTPDSEKDGDSKEPLVPLVDLSESMWRMLPHDASAVCVSIGVYSDNSIIIVDLDRIEENLAKLKQNCLLTVSVNDAGECCGIHKFGSGSIDALVTRDVVSAGLILGQRISKTLTTLSRQKLKH